MGATSLQKIHLQVSTCIHFKQLEMSFLLCFRIILSKVDATKCHSHFLRTSHGASLDVIAVVSPYGAVCSFQARGFMSDVAVVKFLSVLVREHSQPQERCKCVFTHSGFWDLKKKDGERRVWKTLSLAKEHGVGQSWASREGWTGDAQAGGFTHGCPVIQ